jgi:histidinol-phosphate aminotransferase
MEIKEIEKLARQNILSLKPYASARSEFKGQASVFLDANENPNDTGFNRYPDPLQRKVKAKIGAMKGVKPENIFLGNGSDEAIDLLIRIFCEPGEDHIVILPPTYGMYEVSAAIANIPVKKVKLLANFQPDVEAILKTATANSKLLFLCSPNNPTGNCFSQEAIIALANQFPGITVVDEAYIDFATTPGCLSMLDRHPRLVIMQTFSKAWGMAGIRLGMAFAHPDIIHLFNKVKPPYNINQLTQDAALKALDRAGQVKAWVKDILVQRTLLEQQLAALDFVQRIYPSSANFLLLKVEAPVKVYQFLVSRGIIVRDRSRVTLCEGCLRITVGTANENEQLFQTLLEYH